MPVQCRLKFDELEENFKLKTVTEKKSLTTSPHWQWQLSATNIMFVLRVTGSLPVPVVHSVQAAAVCGSPFNTSTTVVVQVAVVHLRVLLVLVGVLKPNLVLLLEV